MLSVWDIIGQSYMNDREFIAQAVLAHIRAGQINLAHINKNTRPDDSVECIVDEAAKVWKYIITGYQR